MDLEHVVQFSENKDGNIVKKTFVPQHIINQIPLHQESKDEEALNTIIANYENTYKKYQEEKSKNTYLQNELARKVPQQQSRFTVNHQAIGHTIESKMTSSTNRILGRCSQNIAGRLQELFEREISRLWLIIINL